MKKSQIKYMFVPLNLPKVSNHSSWQQIYCGIKCHCCWPLAGDMVSFPVFLFPSRRPQCQRLVRGYGLANVRSTPCVAALSSR